MKEVSTQEFMQMAQRCRDELKDLRAIIDRLQPKADAYDNIAAVLRLLPRPPQGMSEDLVWRLDKRIAELMAPPTNADGNGAAGSAGEEHAND